MGLIGGRPIVVAADVARVRQDSPREARVVLIAGVIVIVEESLGEDCMRIPVCESEVLCI